MKVPIGEIVGHRSDPRTFTSSPLLVDNKVFIGVEIELEDVEGFDERYFKATPFWKIVREQSLRNNGRNKFQSSIHKADVRQLIKAISSRPVLSIWPTSSPPPRLPSTPSNGESSHHESSADSR